MSLLELANVRHTAGNRKILDLPTLSIEAGQRLLLLGPSGSGKTTLLHLMAGLLRLQEGRICFNGQDYASLHGTALDALRRRHFGIVLQRLDLIGHLNIRQNISLAASHMDKDRLAALVTRLGLAGKLQHAAHSLSHGEAQRAAIARALANSPDVVLADEPTSALDDRHAQDVMQLLLDETAENGAALVVATHDARIRPFFKNVLELQL
jgi:putative ABC transport system ATP-binding protein